MDGWCLRKLYPLSWYVHAPPIHMHSDPDCDTHSRRRCLLHQWQDLGVLHSGDVSTVCPRTRDLCNAYPRRPRQRLGRTVTLWRRHCILGLEEEPGAAWRMGSHSWFGRWFGAFGTTNRLSRYGIQNDWYRRWRQRKALQRVWSRGTHVKVFLVDV